MAGVVDKQNIKHTGPTFLDIVFEYVDVLAHNRTIMRGCRLLQKNGGQVKYLIKKERGRILSTFRGTWPDPQSKQETPTYIAGVCVLICFVLLTAKFSEHLFVINSKRLIYNMLTSDYDASIVVVCCKVKTFAVNRQIFSVQKLKFFWGYLVFVTKKGANFFIKIRTLISSKIVNYSFVRYHLTVQSNFLPGLRVVYAPWLSSST